MVFHFHNGDAIIDRIAHDSYQINITSIDADHDRSMREVYGLDITISCLYLSIFNPRPF